MRWRRPERPSQRRPSSRLSGRRAPGVPDRDVESAADRSGDAEHHSGRGRGGVGSEVLGDHDRDRATRVDQHAAERGGHEEGHAPRPKPHQADQPDGGARSDPTTTGRLPRRGARKPPSSAPAPAASEKTASVQPISRSSVARPCSRTSQIGVELVTVTKATLVKLPARARTPTGPRRSSGAKRARIGRRPCGSHSGSRR